MKKVIIRYRLKNSIKFRSVEMAIPAKGFGVDTSMMNKRFMETTGYDLSKYESFDEVSIDILPTA